MRATWIEIERYDTAPGSRDRDAIATFVVDHAGTAQWHWLSEEKGTFEAAGRTFRISQGGVNSDQWVIEELMTPRSPHK